MEERVSAPDFERMQWHLNRYPPGFLPAEMAGKVLCTLLNAWSDRKDHQLSDQCAWVPALKSSPERLAEVREIEAEADEAEQQAREARRAEAIKRLLKNDG